MRPACDLQRCAAQCRLPAVTIRDVPEATRRELAARAAGAGQSLQEYVRALLIDSVRHPTQDMVVDRIRAEKERFGLQFEE